MTTFNEKAPLFSLSHRQDLVTLARREAGARMTRVLVRLRLASAIESAQEKLRQAEDRTLRPRRVTTPRPGLWQQVKSLVAGGAPAVYSPPEPEATGNEIEIAREQLGRLLATDGPVLLQHAELVAQALEADREDTSIAPEPLPQAASPGSRNPGRRGRMGSEGAQRPRQRFQVTEQPASGHEADPSGDES